MLSKAPRYLDLPQMLDALLYNSLDHIRSTYWTIIVRTGLMFPEDYAWWLDCCWSMY